MLLEMEAPATVPAATIQRALRLLEYQRRASRAYYVRHRETVKARSIAYWDANRDAINERRRARYHLAHPPAPATEKVPELK